MKTIGRILIILLTAGLIAAAIFAAVNASGSSAHAGFGEPFNNNGAQTRAGFPASGNGEFRPGGSPLGGFRDGGHPERGGEAGGWLFGTIRNVGIVAVIVTVIVLPKKLLKKRAVPAVVKPETQ